MPLLGGSDIALLSGQTRQQHAIRVASEQHHQLRRDQLGECGWSKGKVDGAIRSGWLVRTGYAVYALAAVPASRWAREATALLEAGLDAVLIGRSVLEVLGLVPRSDHKVELSCPRQIRARDGVTKHQFGGLTRRDLARRERLPMTTVERALLDAAGDLDVDQLTKAFDEACHRRLTSTTKLRELLARNPRHPGAKRLQRLTDPTRRSQFTESKLAAKALELIRQAGLPAPVTEPNLLGLGYRADNYWPEAQLALEIDSYAFHGADEQNFNRDRIKDRAWAEHDILTVRWSESDIVHRSLQITAQLAVQIARRTERIMGERRAA